MPLPKAFAYLPPAPDRMPSLQQLALHKVIHQDNGFLNHGQFLSMKSECYHPLGNVCGAQIRKNLQQDSAQLLRAYYLAQENLKSKPLGHLNPFEMNALLADMQVNYHCGFYQFRKFVDQRQIAVPTAGFEASFSDTFLLSLENNALQRSHVARWIKESQFKGQVYEICRTNLYAKTYLINTSNRSLGRHLMLAGDRKSVHYQYYIDTAAFAIQYIEGQDDAGITRLYLHPISPSDACSD